MDACQLRSEGEDLRKYLSLGFLTLVTGSKFYCGPPFCGAVLFPRAALAELEAGCEHLPAGFEDYFTRHEVRVIVIIPSSPFLWVYVYVGEAHQYRDSSALLLLHSVLDYCWTGKLPHAGSCALQLRKIPPRHQKNNGLHVHKQCLHLEKPFRCVQRSASFCSFCTQCPSYTGRLQVLETALSPPQVGKPRAAATMGKFPDQYGGCEEHPQEEFEHFIAQVPGTKYNDDSKMLCLCWVSMLVSTTFTYRGNLLFVTLSRFLGSTSRNSLFL